MNRVLSTFSVHVRRASERLDQKRACLYAPSAKPALIKRCVAPANLHKSVRGKNKALRHMYSFSKDIEVKPSGLFLALAFAILIVPTGVFGQGAPIAVKSEFAGESAIGERGIQKSTAEIMNDPAAHTPRSHIYLKRELEIPGRENRPQHPDALPLSHSAGTTGSTTTALASPAIVSGGAAPQTIGVKFDGVTGPADTGAFPPDSMGAVGPTQFIIFVNGRLASYSKATGFGDGVLN